MRVFNSFITGISFSVDNESDDSDVDDDDDEWDD